MKAGRERGWSDSDGMWDSGEAGGSRQGRAAAERERDSPGPGPTQLLGFPPLPACESSSPSARGPRAPSLQQQGQRAGNDGRTVPPTRHRRQTTAYRFGLIRQPRALSNQPVVVVRAGGGIGRQDKTRQLRRLETMDRAQKARQSRRKSAPDKTHQRRRADVQKAPNVGLEPTASRCRPLPAVGPEWIEVLRATIAPAGLTLQDAGVRCA